VRWYRGACPVCGGDLHDDFEDEGWVTCFACARSFAASELGLGATRAELSKAAARARSAASDVPAEKAG
jgi:uncharacterized Zn finger protein (UPF0148 family)